jgi:hypothetical protein
MIVRATLSAALTLALLPAGGFAFTRHPTAMHVKPHAPQYHLANNQRDIQKPDKHAHVLFQSQKSTHANTEAYQVKQHFKYDRAHHVTQTN